MSTGIFIFGVVIATMVAAACWLIFTGIRSEQRDRLRHEHEHADAIEAGREHRTRTLADGRTIDLD